MKTIRKIVRFMCFFDKSDDYWQSKIILENPP